MAGFILWARFVSHRSNFLYFSLLFQKIRCFFFNFLYCSLRFFNFLYFSLMFFIGRYFSLMLFTFLYLKKHVSRFHGGFMASFILWARFVSHRSNFLYFSLLFYEFRCLFFTGLYFSLFFFTFL